MKFHSLKLLIFTSIYTVLNGHQALSYFTPNLTRRNYINPVRDHIAQEQRLALQIITTDSDSTNTNLIPLSSSNSKESDRKEGARSMNFDNQYNLLNSQLSKVASQNLMTTQQAVAPKRIVINLNALNSNGSDEDRGVTRLTIGFAPQDETPKSQITEGKQKSAADKSDSERSKAYILPDNSPKRDTSSTTNRSPGGSSSSSSGSGGGSSGGSSSTRPTGPSSAMRSSSLMEGVWRQGGIPAMVMRNREEMNERKKPQLKFMLNSDTIDRHLQQREQPQNGGLQQQQQQRQQQQLIRSIQPSESTVESTTGEVGLHGELESLSGEIDSLNEQLGERSGRRTQVNRHDGGYNNRQTEATNRLMSPQQTRNSRSSAFPSEQEQVREGHYDRLSDDTYNDSTMTVMSSDNRNNDIRDNHESHDFSKENNNNNNNNNNNYDYAIYKSGPPRDYLEGDERNQELGLVRVDNLASLSKQRHDDDDFHPPRLQVSVDREGVQRVRQQQQHHGSFDSRSGGSNNRVYESAKLEKSPSNQVDSMHNFAGTHRWRQRDSSGPLLMDNGSNEPLDEQQEIQAEQAQHKQRQHQQRQPTGVDDDNVGRSNDISASVVAGDSGVVLNIESTNQQQVDANSLRKKEKIAATKQRTLDRELKLDERVAQLLDRLKLYTTRDQLMKVARDLQGYPTREEAMRELNPNAKATPIPAKQVRKVGSSNGKNQTAASTKEALKTSQTQEPRYHYDDSTAAEGDTTTVAGGLTEYESSSPYSSEARNIIPGPIEYNPEDSFVTSASASSREHNRLGNFDNLMQTATDQVEDLRPGSETDGRQDNNSEGSKLLDEFRERQMRLKSIQDASDSGHDIEGDADSAAADEGVQKTNSDNITDDSNETADNSLRNNDSQVADESGSNDVYDGTASAAATENAAADPEDANEYSTSRDLLELFKNNARLFDTDNGDGFARRSGELLPPPSKRNSTQVETGGNEISIDVAGREPTGNDSTDDDNSAFGKTHPKEEQEIKALEQIIDELVAREKKEKSESKKAKKRQ